MKVMEADRERIEGQFDHQGYTQCTGIMRRVRDGRRHVLHYISKS
jgi:hypothetical protein